MPIVTIIRRPDSPTLVYLNTPRTLARTMGQFPPARYIGNTPAAQGCSYVIDAAHLRALHLFATANGITLIGTPTTTRARTPQPLPECRHCGQPAARTSRPTHCPTCHQPWHPITWPTP